MTAVHTLDAEDLTSLVAEIFIGLFGELTEAPIACNPHVVDLPVVGFVAVRGGWHAEVVVACTEQAARRLAEHMFLLPAAQVGADDMCDVVGEVANVVGGNLKSLMPGPSALSLPHTSLDGGGELMYLDEFVRLDLRWFDEPLQLRITIPTP